MTPVLVLLTVVAFGIALSLWLPAYRLRRALRRPFPRHFSAILARNIPAYGYMPAHLRSQLQRLIKQFLHQKKFVGCGGLSVTDEMRVTIAGKACLLLLNRRTDVYPALRTVLVYPSAFVAPRQEIGIGGVVTHASQHLAGESWTDGRVVLAWDHVKHGSSDAGGGHDVALHEFAHQLDSESGSMNGAPLMKTAARYRSWSTVMAREFERLQLATLYQAPTVLDHYGATSPAEFFAVATETFFGKPAELAVFHPELFGELQGFYRVDPRDWLPAPDVSTAGAV
ncbi:MAG TPA: M90 family metallopeptidase [Paucimonas sp.]|nr:M90 family metallopeptidase [Paucimonas sp.]